MIKKITLLCIFISTLSFSQDFRFGKVSEEELLETEHPKYPEADAAILYREMKTIFDYNEQMGFHTYTSVFERVKIYTKEGMDWATKTITLYQGDSDDELHGLKGYTYYLDGNKVKDERLRNNGIFDEEVNEYVEKTKFTLPQVKPGSVVEYEYNIRSPFIGNIDAYKFQEEIPVNKVEMTFKSPEYFSYKMHRRGWLPMTINEIGGNRSVDYNYRPSSSQAGGFRTTRTRRTSLNFKETGYSVSLKDVPPIKKEAYAGNINNYVASLKFELSYVKYPDSPLEMVSTNWEDVSKSIYQSSNFGTQLAKSNYFDKDLNEILEGASNEQEKIIRIFEFVKAKMNWNGYSGVYAQEGVRSAYKNGVGNAADINLMLVAMLRNAGIDANPVLASTKSHGIPIFPTRNGFNFVIAAVELQDNVMIMDATNKESTPNVLQEELLNWQGRLIRENGSSTWVSLVPNQYAMENCMMQYSIDTEDLLAKGSSRTQYSGHLAMKNRSRLKNVSDSERIKLLEKSISGIEIDSSSLNDVKNSYKPLTMSFDFQAPEAIEEIGGKLYISPMLFHAIEENPFKLEERKYPIDFGYPYKKRYLITMNVPEGYTVETIPESVNFAIADGNGTFKYMVQNSNNTIQCSIEVSISKSWMDSSSYPELKKLFQLMWEKENEKVVLTKA